MSASLDRLVTMSGAERAAWAASLGTALPQECDAAVAEAEGRLAREPAFVLDAAEALEDAARAGGALLQSARAARIASHALAYLGRLDDAIAAAGRSRDAALAAGAPVDAARADVASMHPLAKAGRPLEAIERGIRAREAMRSAGAGAMAARAELNLANVFRLLGRHPEALASLDAALESLGTDATVAGQLQNSRGEVLLALGRIGDAEAAFVRARELLAGDRSRFASGMVAGNLADLHARAGRAGSALALFEDARAALRAEGATGHVARLEAEEAELLEAIGASDDALETARRAMLALEPAGHAWECARAEDTMARALLALGRAEDAALSAERAAARWSKLGHAGQSRLSMLASAEAAALGGAAAEALASAIAAAGGAEPLERARALGVAARIAAGAALPQARDVADQAVAAAEALAVAPILADALESRARASLAAGDAHAAGADAVRAIDVTESMRGSLQAERLRGAAIGRRVTAAAVAVRAAIASGNADGALAAVERTRDRGLLEAMRSGAQAEPSPRARELEARLNELYARIAQPGRPGERRVELDVWRTAVREVERELDRAERASPAVAAHGPREARSSLRQGEVLLAWFTGLDRVLCFAIAPGHETTVIDACDASQAADLAARLEFLLRRPVPDSSSARAERLRRSIDECMAALHALLVATLPDWARGADRRIVVPHGFLCGVPFHAIGAFGAACERETSYVPSLSALVERRRAPIRPCLAGPALVAAVPDALAPEVGTEAEEVARLLRASGVETRLMVGEHATAEAFAAAVGGCGLVHVATHGRFDAAHPRLSGLRFADRWMNASEIGALPLAGARVILSGCETGRASIGRGHETGGLLRALCEAGVAEAVATLWPVHDASAAGLASRLHAAAPASANPASLSLSLHRMQLEAVEAGVPAARWAPFVALTP